jgi:hypothetical protein
VWKSRAAVDFLQPVGPITAEASRRSGILFRAHERSLFQTDGILKEESPMLRRALIRALRRDTFMGSRGRMKHGLG